MDVEHGAREYKDQERESLLPSHNGEEPLHKPQATAQLRTGQFGFTHLLIAFVTGTLACFLAQYAICGSNCFSYYTSESAPPASAMKEAVNVLAPPWVGSTERHNFPPASPTNAFPSLFPTDVGYPGGTPTGAEPAVIATAPAYPIHAGAPVLVAPSRASGSTGEFSSLPVFRGIQSK